MISARWEVRWGVRWLDKETEPQRNRAPLDTTLTVLDESGEELLVLEVLVVLLEEGLGLATSSGPSGSGGAYLGRGEELESGELVTTLLESGDDLADESGVSCGEGGSGQDIPSLDTVGPGVSGRTGSWIRRSRRHAKSERRVPCTHLIMM